MKNLEQNNFIENRFGYFRDKTTEELEMIAQELEKDLDVLWKNYNSLDAEKQNDIWNDIKYDNEQLDFISDLLSERLGKSR